MSDLPDSTEFESKLKSIFEARGTESRRYYELLSDAAYIVGLAESKFEDHPRITKFKEKYLTLAK